MIRYVDIRELCDVPARFVFQRIMWDEREEPAFAEHMSRFGRNAAEHGATDRIRDYTDQGEYWSNGQYFLTFDETIAFDFKMRWC